MKILVVNAGSSSLKLQLIEEKNKKFITLYKGIVDGIGKPSCFLKIKNLQNNKEFTKKKVYKNHESGLKDAIKLMKDEEIDAVGHRVVHGGEKYTKATTINAAVKKVIKNLSDLAPLHNPPNLEGIHACEKLLKGIPNVAIFDTAFHQTIPEKAYLYALPYKYYLKYGIRRYGFHGTSHKYVTNETLKLLKKKGKVVTCHLGNGSSIAASINGKCMDTSMGFTPLEGIPMGTRSGDIDPAIIFYLMKKEKLTAHQLDNILNKKSGLLGMTEVSSDMRIIWKKAEKNNKKVLRALDILSYRIAKYISAYAASLNGIDAITFTGGIGEKAWYIRKMVCEQLEFMGIKLDSRSNKSNEIEISSDKSKVKVFAIPTNEGLQIAKESIAYLRKRKNKVK